MDHSLPGSSVHGNFQARVLECVAISFSRGSCWSGDRTQVSHISGRRFTLWATRETPSRCIKVKVVEMKELWSWAESMRRQGSRFHQKRVYRAGYSMLSILFLFILNVFIEWSCSAGSSLLHLGFLYLWRRLLSNHGAWALEVRSVVAVHWVSCLSCVIFPD